MARRNGQLVKGDSHRSLIVGLRPRSLGRRSGWPRATSSAVAPVDSLTAEEHAWLVADEERWRRAQRIAERHPGVDVGGVYHVLRNLEKTPSQRLRAALDHGRLFGLGLHRR